MAQKDKVAQVTTGLTFTREGVLVPPNTPILVDEDLAQAEAEKDKEADKALVDFDPNAPVAAPVAVAAIGPTGPNPTVPQQIPPGAETLPGGGYAADGAQLVAEGSEQAIEVEEKAEPRGGKKKVDPLS